MRERLFSEAKEIAEIHQRQGNAEPETQQRQHGCKRNRSRAVLSPNEEVQEEAGAKYNSRIQSCSLQNKFIQMCNLVEYSFSSNTAEEIQKSFTSGLWSFLSQILRPNLVKNENQIYSTNA